MILLDFKFGNRNNVWMTIVELVRTVAVIRFDLNTHRMSVQSTSEDSSGRGLNAFFSVNNSSNYNIVVFLNLAILMARPQNLWVKNGEFTRS